MASRRRGRKRDGNTEFTEIGTQRAQRRRRNRKRNGGVGIVDGLTILFGRQFGCAGEIPKWNG